MSNNRLDSCFSAYIMQQKEGLFMAIRPCISYPGGKWKALPQILELIPDGIVDWREPFFGGGSVTFGFLQSEKSKDCKRFVVSDLATEVYALWKGIQEDADKVISICEEWWNEKCPTHVQIHTTPMMYEAVWREIEILRGKDTQSTSEPTIKAIWEKAEAEAIAFWDWAAKVDCTKLTLQERAARFYLVNKVSFSGMGDSGSLSKDQYINFNIAQVERIKENQPLLQRIEIYNQSFEKTFEGCPVEGGFIFLDPPYLQQEKSGLYGRNGDTHHGFPHKEFAELCKQTKTPWLITYDDSIAVRRLFRGKGIYIRPFKLTYTMAGKTAEDALAGEELFIANYDIQDKSSYDILNEIL